jgi:flagellar hook-associated protein 3 FlgL
MSGTLGSIYSNVSFALNLHADALARLQEQASTGSRINRVSDSPSVAYRILGLNSEERSLVNYLDNLSEVVSSLEHSSAAIGHIILSVVETKTRLTQITNGIYNQDGRRMLAEGINDTLEHVVLLANT